MRRKLMYVALALAAAGAANALMVKLTTAELVDHASLVIVGTVTETRSFPPDAQGMIFTEAKVRITDTVVGATADDVVTVRVHGGEYGDLGVVVEDQPVFRTGEQVVLFLAPAEGGGYWCPDAFQGKYTVVDGTVLPRGVTLTEFLAEVAKAAGR